MEALRKSFENRPIPAERAKKMIAENPGIDANKDGKLTMGEAQKWWKAQHKTKPAAKDDKKAKKAPKAKKAKDSKKAPKAKKAKKDKKKKKAKKK